MIDRVRVGLVHWKGKLRLVCPNCNALMHKGSQEDARSRPGLRREAGIYHCWNCDMEVLGLPEEIKDELVRQDARERQKRMRHQYNAAQRRARLRPQPGYVYLLHAPEVQCYKIGRSKEIKSRVALLNIQLPFDVQLVHKIECADYISAEKALHLRFADKHLRGEWFALTDEDVAEIKAIEAM